MAHCPDPQALFISRREITGSLLLIFFSVSFLPSRGIYLSGGDPLCLPFRPMLLPPLEMYVKYFFFYLREILNFPHWKSDYFSLSGSFMLCTMKFPAIRQKGLIPGARGEAKKILPKTLGEIECHEKEIIERLKPTKPKTRSPGYRY